MTVTTYRNIKKDVVFRYLNVEPITAVAAVHSVGTDRNCGFRAVSFDVYQDQAKWTTVKADMLKTYLKYKDTLFKVVDTDVVVQFEEQRMIKRLQSTKSPCLDDLHLWFSTFICPQLVADTYERPVIMYCYVENCLKTGEKRINYESQWYVPLINMQLADSSKPITLLLAFSHFYYVEFSHTPKGRMKKFNKPVLNMDHQRLRNDYPNLCNPTDYSVLF
ncbi:MAG: hypothetical protein EXX96DRAFT_542532 [Benjaminiella poitrasii]|nr:MAG: hypothetical protein EXX96DRAFT_542532 [Benjaminiella poitrasii]